MRRIAHISDLHFGSHDPSVSEGLLAALRELSPHLVAVTGDLTQRARAWEFRTARAFLERIASPILVVPGNHDVPLYNIFARLFRPHARFERFITRDRRPRYVDQEIAALGLNTAWDKIGTRGRVRHDHLAAIRESFADIGDAVTRILVTHHPLFDADPDDARSAARGAEAALQELAAAGVKLLLAGHNHRPYSGAGTIDFLDSERSVLVMQAGTAVSTRLRGGPNSFNVIDIADARVDCTPMFWRGGRFEADAAMRFAFEGGRWSTVAERQATSVNLTLGGKYDHGQLVNQLK